MQNSSEETEEIILLNDNAIKNLSLAAKMAKIVGLINMSLIGIVGVIFVLMTITSLTNLRKFSLIIMMLAIYACFFIFIMLFHKLYTYGNDTQDAIYEENSESLSFALFNLEKFFRWMTIIIAISTIFVTIVWAFFSRY